MQVVGDFARRREWTTPKVPLWATCTQDTRAEEKNRPGASRRGSTGPEAFLGTSAGRVAAPVGRFGAGHGRALAPDLASVGKSRAKVGVAEGASQQESPASEAVAQTPPPAGFVACGGRQQRDAWSAQVAVPGRISR